MVEFLFKTSRGKPPQRTWASQRISMGKGFRISSLPKWCDDLGWMAKSRPGWTLVLHDRIFGHLLGDFDSWWCFVSFVSLFSHLFFPWITQNVHQNFVSAPCFFEMPTLSSMSFKKGHRWYTHHSSPPPLPGKVLGSWRCLQGIGAIVAPSWGGASTCWWWVQKSQSQPPNMVWDHLFEIMMILIFNTCKDYNINCMKCFTERKSWDIFLSYELVLDGFHPSTVGWRVFLVDSAERLATLPRSFGFWHKRWMTICLMELLLGRYSQQKGETPSFIYPTWFRFLCIKSQ